ncbi:hypothetical protein ACJMK2_038928 [Sinanodonta woodiana]|uniref:SRCR domain-containing protein n=1 Tax=Sinanodonta woodiana TaxID=1069815 RepID=A0ABD3WAJ9_SINWO
MTRACTNPRPAHGGVFCDGDAIRHRECYATGNCRVAARLVSGRLEVMVNGIWGTVCDDHFSSNEANVACRMLGLGGTGSIITAPYGEGPIWLDELSCSGSESTLFECGYFGHTIGVHDCSHSEDVGVHCS